MKCKVDLEEVGWTLGFSVGLQVNHLTRVDPVTSSASASVDVQPRAVGLVKRACWLYTTVVQNPDALTRELTKVGWITNLDQP